MRVAVLILQSLLGNALFLQTPTEPHPTPEPPPSVATNAVSRQAEALKGTVAVLERQLQGRNREVDRLLQLLSREQEFARATQLTIPATTTREHPGDQSARSEPTTRTMPPQATEWSSRLVARPSGA